MVWFTEPLQKKGADGQPCGVWHLCATSDEGGGFYVGCDHDHPTPDAACECEDACIAIGQVTGFPHTPRAERDEEQRLRESALGKLTPEERSALNVR